MAKKNNKDSIIGIRVTKPFRDKLEKQAEKEGLTLTTYIRRLLLTHPDLEEKKNG